MKAQKVRSLGLHISFDVPETIKEYDENAKRPGAALSEAINNVLYRSTLAEFRPLFLHGRDEDKAKGITAFKGVEQVSKIERETKPSGKKDKSGADVLVYNETEGDYFNRVCSKLGVEPSHFQAVADEAAKLVKFDASAPERKPAAPRKLADKYLQVAKQILAGPKKDKFLADVKKALDRTIVLTGKVEEDAVAVGWAVKDFAAWQEAQALLKMVG